jgi:hypothetical protein
MEYPLAELLALLRECQCNEGKKEITPDGEMVYSLTDPEPAKTYQIKQGQIYILQGGSTVHDTLFAPHTDITQAKFAISYLHDNVHDMLEGTTPGEIQENLNKLHIAICYLEDFVRVKSVEETWEKMVKYLRALYVTKDKIKNLTSD